MTSKKNGKKMKKARQRFEVHSGEGRRFNFSRLKQGFVFYVLLLLALVVIVQVGYHWLGEQFLAWRLQVVTAEQGVLEEEKEVEGLVTRSEKVITAPVHGVVMALAEPGKRVSVGTEVARIGVLRDPPPPEQDWEDENGAPDQEAEHNSTNNYRPQDFDEVISIECREAGLLSYYIDGLENRDGPFYLDGEELAEENLPEGTVTAENDRVRAGEPLLKIVDNWKWYYNIVLPLHPGRSIASEREVNLVFGFAPGEQVGAELYQSEIDEDNNEVRLTYLIEKQLPGFEEIRRAEASLYFSRREGVVIPAGAVFEKNHTTGVYLNRGGRVVFEPVTVVGKKDDKALVEGLEPRSLVITRHELVEEGRRLN